MNTFDGEDQPRDPTSPDEVEIRSTVSVVERDGVLLFEVAHLGAWVRSTVVTDLAGNR